MTYTYRNEGLIGGVQYVTVLDESYNPVEYNVALEYATEHYGAQQLDPFSWANDETGWPFEDDR